VDYDEIFDIMGNDVRRKILKHLAQGPMSIGELNEKIDVSRQAILKHLKDLEQRGFIEIHEVEKQGKAHGPSPHRFDLNPLAGNPKIITFQIGLPTAEDKEFEDSAEPQPRISLKEKIAELSMLNKQLEDAAGTYRQISAKKNALMQVLKNVIDRAIPGDEEREVLELLISNPEKSMAGFTLQEVSAELEIREDFMKFILDNLMRVGIVRDDPDGRYYLQ
jgi:ArsR family transcriptional regulator